MLTYIREGFWPRSLSMNLNTLAFQPAQQSINLGQGTDISIETGRIAKQAAGSVVIRQGDTMVLVAVCHAVPVKNWTISLCRWITVKRFCRRQNSWGLV